MSGQGPEAAAERHHAGPPLTADEHRVSGDLLGAVIDGSAGDFAIISRPGRDVTVLVGAAERPESLAGIRLGGRGAPGSEALVLIPYRQLTERGFPAPDDGAPLLALAVTGEERHPLGAVLARLPHRRVQLGEGGFDSDDAAYAATVRAIIDDEIGSGQGANFVIKRTYSAGIADYTPAMALAVLRELLAAERGAYWTFLVRVGDLTLVGASPERHVSLETGVLQMNPISGTYRYPAGGPTLDGVTAFLADRKETEELYMVVDEELKMMCRICEPGSTRMIGPFLKEMAWVAHTEYHLEGRTRRDIRDVLRETMFAPTVTGSPVESAARVIRRYEPAGRGYYSGIIGLAGRDAQGEPVLDSAILIRTASIEPAGRLSISVGSTLVRHSDPLAEVAETQAKAAGLLAAFGAGAGGEFADHPEVVAALRSRNDDIAAFWAGLTSSATRSERLHEHNALVIDAEDTFTAMLEHQLRMLGLSVTIRRFDEDFDLAGHDLVVVGPGPGDPCAADDPKIAKLAAVVDELLGSGRPFMATCLSHQVLSRRLGLPVLRRSLPNQGTQRWIDLFGSRERVGFYNTFSARSEHDRLDTWAGAVQVSRDPGTAEVHALRGPRFASVQFHPESLLTIDGPRILTGMAEGVLAQ